MRKTLSVLALILSLLTVLSFSAVTGFAADSSEESDVDVSVDTSEDDSSEDLSSEDPSSEDPSSEDPSSEDDSSKTDDKSESTQTVPGESKNDGDNSDNKKTEDESEFPWALVIFLGALVIVVVVCFICIKRENKFGLWLKKFFKDYKSELKKIVWASKEFTVKSTIVVIVCLVICGLVISLLDLGLTALVLKLIEIVGK